MSRAASPRLLDQPLWPDVVGDKAEHFRAHGMYPPNERWRQGAAAFIVRDDLTLRDALKTVDELLRQADGIASMLACDDNADAHISGAAEAISHLLKQSRGLHSLVPAAVEAFDADRGMQ